MTEAIKIQPAAVGLTFVQAPIYYTSSVCLRISKVQIDGLSGLPWVAHPCQLSAHFVQLTHVDALGFSVAQGAFADEVHGSVQPSLVALLSSASADSGQ